MSRLTRTVNLYPTGTFNRWLHVQIPARDHGSGLVHFTAHRSAGSVAQARICQTAPVGPTLAQIEGRTEHAGQSCKTEEPLVMAVHRVAKASVPVRVQSNHAVNVH